VASELFWDLRRRSFGPLPHCSIPDASGAESDSPCRVWTPPRLPAGSRAAKKDLPRFVPGAQDLVGGTTGRPPLPLQKTSFSRRRDKAWGMPLELPLEVFVFPSLRPAAVRAISLMLPLYLPALGSFASIPVLDPKCGGTFARASRLLVRRLFRTLFTHVLGPPSRSFTHAATSSASKVRPSPIEP